MNSGPEMETTTENTLQPLSSKHKVVITADQAHFEAALAFCRDKFGHRGAKSGWWWRVNKKWKDRKFVFTFENEQDALAFKLIKG